MTITKYEYPTNVSIDGEPCTRVVEVFIDEKSGEERTVRYFITPSGRTIGGEEG